MPTLVAIAGGSGSGKSSLAREFARRHGPATIISQDWYYRSLTAEESAVKVNFDDPERIDHELFMEQLTSLGAGVSIAAPQYSFIAHQRMETKLDVAPEAIVLVEGLYPYWYPPVRPLFHCKVFVDAQTEHRVARRMGRDVEQRGRRLEEIEKQIIESVLPMHELYVQPQCGLADLVINNDHDIESAVMELQQGLARLLGRPGLFALGGT